MPTIEELALLQKSTEVMERPSNFDSESIRFAQFTLENNQKHTPEVLVHKLWPFFDMEMSLTNLSEKNIGALMSELKIGILNMKMASPDYSKTYDDITNWDGTRAKFFAKVMRSTGGMARERALQATQIRQLLTDHQDGPGGGVLAKIGSMFGGRK